MIFLFIATLCSKQWAAFNTFVHLKNSVPPSLKRKRGSKKGELDELSRCYIQEKRITLVEIWKCGWLRLYNTTTNIKQDIRGNFPYRRLLTYYQNLVEIKIGKLFRFVQCDNKVPENFRAIFAVASILQEHFRQQESFRGPNEVLC